MKKDEGRGSEEVVGDENGRRDDKGGLSLWMGVPTVEYEGEALQVETPAYSWTEDIFWRDTGINLKVYVGCHFSVESVIRIIKWIRNLLPV